MKQNTKPLTCNPSGDQESQELNWIKIQTAEYDAPELVNDCQINDELQYSVTEFRECKFPNNDATKSPCLLGEYSVVITKDGVEKYNGPFKDGDEFVKLSDKIKVKMLKNPK